MEKSFQFTSIILSNDFDELILRQRELSRLISLKSEESAENVNQL